MIACVDVDYRDGEAVAACVLFHAWEDPAAAAEEVVTVTAVAPYEPGQFFRRELPCLLAVLGRLPAPPAAVVVDGYVWLDGAGTPGLGAHLYEALGRSVPVIGVAKTRFRGAAGAVPVTRGDSRKPLFVTAAGADPAAAAAHVRAMHGPFRIPTLLRRVDHLCRSATSTAPRTPPG